MTEQESTANPVNWFEIPVHDLERARAFYEFVLGVELSMHEVGPPAWRGFPCTRALAGRPAAWSRQRANVAHFEDSEGNRVALHSTT